MEYFISIDFGLAEQLRGEAKEIAERENLQGLVAIKTKYNESNSQITFELEQIKGSPTKYIRGLAKKEGINLNKIMSALT